MKGSEITIFVRIDAKLFRDFAVFDALRMKKRWRPPALFALILLVSAIICFSRHRVTEQAVFMGVFLLVIGFGLPIIYFINFFNSIKDQIHKFELGKKQPFYTVTLSEISGGIQVATKNGEIMEYQWTDISGVYQGKNCIYLYVQNGRAYLLPDEDVADKAEVMRNLFQQSHKNNLWHQ